jgi:glycosyltransferase involved in cell wall biosynthesis
MYISIVAPIYNEEDNVEPLCQRLNEVLSQAGIEYEIILVDDGSTDNSWNKLVECAKLFKGLRLIRLRRNFGQTAAMTAGIDAARGDVIITMDADLQNDPADIPLLLQKMEEGYDVVSGWRKDRKDPFLSRKFPSMIANAIIASITGVKLHDFGCTLKAYRREVMKNVRLYGEMHRFIPALVYWVGGKTAEAVVSHHPRKYGKSKYGLSRTIRVLLDLITVSFLMRYSKSPIQMFGKIGIYLIGIGVLIFLFMIASHISYLLFHTMFAASLIKREFWIITPFMLIFFGIQFISMGLLAEIQIRTYYESQNKPIYTIRETFEPGK